jgi:hypothetical protein
MKEYDLDIDDMRWYKSCLTAQELLSHQENVDELIQLIWSGKLSDQLHDMEEKYIEDLQDQLDRDILDEAGIRETLAEAYAQKNKRTWKKS